MFSGTSWHVKTHHQRVSTASLNSGCESRDNVHSQLIDSVVCPGRREPIPGGSRMASLPSTPWHTTESISWLWTLSRDSQPLFNDDDGSPAVRSHRRLRFPYARGRRAE